MSEITVLSEKYPSSVHDRRSYRCVYYHLKDIHIRLNMETSRTFSKVLKNFQRKKKKMQELCCQPNILFIVDLNNHIVTMDMYVVEFELEHFEFNS